MPQETVGASIVFTPDTTGHFVPTVELQSANTSTGKKDRSQGEEGKNDRHHGDYAKKGRVGRSHPVA